MRNMGDRRAEEASCVALHTTSQQLCTHKGRGGELGGGGKGFDELFLWGVGEFDCYCERLQVCSPPTIVTSIADLVKVSFFLIA